MKRYLSALFFLSVSLLMAGELPVTVEPYSPVAGEPFMIVLETDSATPPEIRMPQVPGVKISRRVTGTRSSTSIINGKRSFKASFAFQALADKPGKYTIPAITASYDGKTSASEPFVITVRDPADLTAPDGSMPDRVAAAMRIEPARRLYAGETAKLLLELIVPQSVQLGGIREIAESGFADAFFIPQGNSRSKFVQSGSRRTAKNGIGYTIYEFTAWFQVQAPGRSQPECRLVLQTTVPGNDGIFDSFFGVSKELVIRAKTKEPLVVASPPPPPAGTVDTGLVGSWQLKMSLPPEISGGKVAEAVLEITGTTPPGHFPAPEIKFPRARMYPAEVKTGPAGVTVKYPFVPLAPGKLDFTLPLAVFVPESGKWEVTDCHLVSTVSNELLTASPSPVPEAGREPTVLPDAGKVREFPLYPREGGRSVKLPLLENQKTAIIILLTTGMVLFTAGILRRIKWHKDDTAKVRRQLRALAQEIEKSGSAGKVLHRHGLAEIAQALQLPAGATAQEISRAVRDPEVAEFFRDLDSTAFAPGGAETESASGRKQLIRFLKTFVLLLLLGTTFRLHGDFQRGRAEYDRGNFAAARELFAQCVDPENCNPNAVFNFGCPAYMLGQYPAATLAFEQALLLAPSDAGFRSALHDSRARTAGGGEPDDGSFGGFITGMRDRVRPDTYLLFAAAAFAVLGGLFCAGRFPGKRSAAVAVTLFMILCAAAAVSQLEYRYNPQRALIVVPQAELHRIPGNTGSVAAVLPGGSEVMIVRDSGSWCQVKSRTGQEGWLTKNAVERVFPHGIW